MKHSNLRAVYITLALVLVSQYAPAEVVDSSAHGFTVRSTVTVNTSSKKAYQTFVQDIGRWWDPEHTYSGNASNLSIVARLGGLFSEELPGGGFIEHMRVVCADPGKLLRM